MLATHALGFVDHLGGEVARADLAHLARAHQLVERAERLVDRHGAVGHVQLVEVDAIGAEPAEAVFDGAPDVRRARTLVVLVDLRAELRRDDRFVPTAGESAPEVLLAARPAVHVGGVKQVDTGIECSPHHGFGLLAIDAHPEVVAPDAYRRDLQ